MDGYCSYYVVGIYLYYEILFFIAITYKPSHSYAR